MNHTFTLPKNLLDDIEALKRNLGMNNVDTTIKYLLKNAVVREKKLLVARLYQDRRKTLRQCAEMLNVDLEEMMNILRDFRIPFGQDDLAQQLKIVKKLAKQMRTETVKPG